MKIIKSTIVAFIIMSTLLSLSACQPTPDTEAVVNKGDDSLMDIIESSNATNNNLIGETSGSNTEKWTDEWKASDDLNVSVDAMVNIPDVLSFAVYQVEPDKFDIETVTQLKKDFFGDAQLYYTDLAAGKIYTKAELEEMIVGVRQELNDPSSDLNKMAESEGKDELRKALQDELKLLEKKYQNAPEEVHYEPIEITQVNLEKGIFSIVNQDEGTVGFYVSDIDDDLGRHNSITCYYPRTDKYAVLQYEEMTQEKAENIAETYVEKLGADMSINRTILVDTVEANHYKCYDIVFTKFITEYPRHIQNRIRQIWSRTRAHILALGSMKSSLLVH
jgi:hypothetical protein